MTMRRDQNANQQQPIVEEVSASRRRKAKAKKTETETN